MYDYDYKERVVRRFSGETDEFYNFKVVPHENGCALEMRQYVYDDGHADGVGIGVSVIRWDGKGFEAVRYSFEVFD